MKKEKILSIIKKVILGFLGLNVILIVIALFVNVDKGSMNENNIFSPSISMLNFDSSRSYQEIKISSIIENDNLEENTEYGKKVYRFDNESISFSVDVLTTNTYEIAFDYNSLQTDVQDITLNILIDGLTKEEYANIKLPTYWTDGITSHVYDIYNNEVTQMQLRYNVWSNYFLCDQRYYDNDPLDFYLTKGEHVITIERNNGTFLLGNIYLFEKTPLDTFENLSKNLTTNSENEMIILEGENPLYKSSPDIRATSVQYPHVTPFSTSKNMLNNLSGDSFNESGESVTYAFDVKETGYYKIALKYFISQTNTTIYSKIYLDNVVLYNELKRYAFKNTSTNFVNHTLQNEDDELEFYLTKGMHTLTFRIDASLQAPIYNELIALINEINELYLEIVKLTGGNTDKNKTWDIVKYIPDVQETLNNWVERLDDLKKLINEVSKSDASKQNRLYQQIDNAYKKIVSLAKNPNELPHKLNILSKGSSSATLMLSNSLHASTFSPISIEKIYIYGNNQNVPKVNKNIFTTYFATIQRVVRTNVVKTEVETVNIWVNRSTYYVSMMQQFADAYYTPTSNIKVRFSLLPNESKLIYANASNTQPDAALGISSSVPYTLGIRGALANLRTMDGFGQTISNFQAGALMNLTEGEKVYGLPETQDFQVQFYRKDILESLGIENPETYEDIIKILPTLQRYGMNYYMPMAGGSGLKSINITSPFIYQYGGNIYSDDYQSVKIDTPEAIEAITMMVDLFLVYSLPLTTQNFYDSFRNGLSPVGISGFDTYMQFLNAAPEIVGKWGLSLAPGVRGEDGIVNHAQTGDTKTAIIFEKSSKQTEAWNFIKWWLSTEIQEKFASDIQATYGPTYLWNTANINAFSKLALPENDKKIILQQWEYLYAVPQTPATYMVERGISNIWNSAVFSGTSIRAGVTDYSIIINREITRKMIEFKYLDEDGKVLKAYIVPSIEDIKAWQKE